MGKEQIRYERKGFGLLFAAVVALTFFNGIPYLANLYWAPLMQWRISMGLDYTLFMLLAHMTQHTIMYSVINAGYQVFYHFEFPFIEKYKTNYQEAWPWKDDAESWHKLVKEALPVFLLNSMVLMPVVIYLLSFLPSTVEHSMA